MTWELIEDVDDQFLVLDCPGGMSGTIYKGCNPTQSWLINDQSTSEAFISTDFVSIVNPRAQNFDVQMTFAFIIRSLSDTAVFDVI